MDFITAYHEIISRAPEHKFSPTTDRVIEALDMLGNPQNAYKTVHITGTNGKTSTAIMTENLLLASNLRTSRFTSPHLQSVTERICINAIPISELEFVKTYEYVKPFIQKVDSTNENKIRMSFFEVLTVMAYVAFKNANVDVAIIEVGMGGKWDATNVINPAASIITSISKDHTTWLGNSLFDIASEKVGIIKQDTPVFTAKQSASVMSVIKSAAAKKNAELIELGANIQLTSRRVEQDKQIIDVSINNATQGERRVYKNINLLLHGQKQTENAALAIGAASRVLEPTNNELLAVGETNRALGLTGSAVECAFSRIQSPGRFEIIQVSDEATNSYAKTTRGKEYENSSGKLKNVFSKIVVDASHNVGGAESLRDTFIETFGRHKAICIIAMMKDKDIERYLTTISPIVSKLIVTSNSSTRSQSPSNMLSIALSSFNSEDVSACDNLELSIEHSKTLVTSPKCEKPILLIAGSVVTAGEALALLKPKKSVSC